MRRIAAVCATALILLADAHSGFVSPTFAQIPSRRVTPYEMPNPSTFEGTPSGGWAGPCEQSWAQSEWPYNAMRVCRVVTYLARSFQNTIDPNVAQDFANQMFRICWGTFPKSGGDCNQPNAWAPWMAWSTWANSGGRGPAPRPIVMTLQAAEVVQSDDEIAFLLSHEMGHALDPVQSREDVEPRADALGIGFMVKAGFDARSAGRSLQMIGRERGQGAIGNVLWTLLNHVNQVATQDTHGTNMDRIYRMKQVFAKGCAAMTNKPIGCKEGWR